MVQAANSHLKEKLDFLSSVRAGSFLEDLFNPQYKCFHTEMKLFYGVCVCVHTCSWTPDFLWLAV